MQVPITPCSIMAYLMVSMFDRSCPAVNHSITPGEYL